MCVMALPIHLGVWSMALIMYISLVEATHKVGCTCISSASCMFDVPFLVSKCVLSLPPSLPPSLSLTLPLSLSLRTTIWPRGTMILQLRPVERPTYLSPSH